MMQVLFSTKRYDTPNEKYRAKILYRLIFLIAVLFTIYALTANEWSAPDTDEQVTLIAIVRSFPSRQEALIFYVVFVMLGLGYFTNYVGRSKISGWALVSTVFTLTLLSIRFSEDPTANSGLIVILFIVTAMFVGGRYLALMWLSSIGLVILRAVSSDAYTNAELTIINLTVVALTGAITIYYFLRYFSISTEDAATEAIEDREVTAEIINRIAPRVAERASLNDLLTEVVNTINERYDFIYHSQVFLIEDNEAYLVASTGKIGQQLLARQHSLSVGSLSVIGQVTLHGQYVIAHSDKQDSVHRHNELLANTAVEAAFPLRLGNTVIGALDVQSQNDHTFDDPKLINTLQALADSISLAIDNAQQFELAQERLTENEALIKETQNALRSVEDLNSRLTGQAWAKYLKNTTDVVQIEMDFDTQKRSTMASLTPGLQETIDNNHFVHTEGDGQQSIAIPLRVRGQVIGAMEFELDTHKEITPDEYDLLQEVGDRFGIAADNIRLVEEGQRNALRERLLNQISTQLQSSHNVEMLVNKTAHSLYDVLNLNKVAIRLGTPPSVNGNGAGGTSNGQ